MYALSVLASLAKMGRRMRGGLYGVSRCDLLFSCIMQASELRVT